ncbi:MAG TPA: hypothetical protein VJL84_10640 [Kiloniellales bacterium]|nr:hypothetical protein [Kiloniellales bacterium]
MAQAAQIIDLAQFRSRRQAQQAAEASGPAMATVMPAFAAPFLWMPVWVYVRSWPATA